MEKDRLMPLLFSETELDLMRRVRDAYNPGGLLNPGKIFPTTKGCGEIHVRPTPIHGCISRMTVASQTVAARLAGIVGAATFPLILLSSRSLKSTASAHPLLRGPAPRKKSPNSSNLPPRKNSLL